MSLSPELLSITILLSLLAGIGAGSVLLRDRADMPWAAGWAVAMVGAILMMNQQTWGFLRPIGHFTGAIHPFLFAAGAYVYARRPVLPGLLLVAVAVGTARAALVLADQETWSVGLALTINPAMLLLAAFVVHRHVVRAGEPQVHRLLPAGFALFAGLAAVDALFQLGLGDRESLWAVWIAFGALFAVLQVFALAERSGRERARAVRALGDNERRFVEISEGGYDLIFEFDGENRLIYTSSGGETALGFRPGQVLGRDGRDLVHPEDLPLLARRLEELEHTPRLRIPPIRVQHADGGWRWLESTVRRYWRENGDERTLLVCRDVTEQREAEEALEAARERLQAVLSSLGPLRVVEFDEQGRVRSIFGPPPASSAEVYGMDRVEASRLSVEDFLPEESARDVLDAIGRVFKTGEPSFVTRNVELPNGTFSFRGALHPLRNADGSVEGALAITEDVTAEVAQDDEEADRADRAERSRRQESLTRLADGLAREFEDLLASIGDHVDRALEGLPAEDPARPWIQSIREARDTASGLTRALRVYAGREVAPEEEIDLSEWVAASEPALRAALPDPARLVLRFAATPCPVRADRQALRRALELLVGRAAVGLADGGTLEVRTALVRVDRRRLLCGLSTGDLAEGDYALLEVRDDGPTIPYGQVDRLFEPFSGSGPNTHGIGLAEVVGIVRAHRGAIEVESGPERGTALRLLLPHRVASDGARPR